MRVEIDADLCGGFGTCVGKAPTVFELTDNGYTVVLLPDVPEELEVAVQEAVGALPDARDLRSREVHACERRAVPHRTSTTRCSTTCIVDWSRPGCRTVSRGRLAAGRFDRRHPRAGRVLAQRLRLAGPGGPTQRVPPVPDRDRRTASTSCTSGPRTPVRWRWCSCTGGRDRSSSSSTWSPADRRKVPR